MKTLNIPLCCAILALAIFQHIAVAAESPSTGPVALGMDGTKVMVRPLDDPQNPFAGDYNDWDRWIYEHNDPALEIADWREHLEASPGNGLAEYSGSQLQVLQGLVDAEGFLLPSEHVFRRKLDPAGMSAKEYFEQQYNSDQQTPPFSTLFAKGELTWEQYEDYLHVFERGGAREYPPIPAWIGENPPARMVVLPEGEILVLGEMGQGDTSKDFWKNSHQHEQLMRWYRYSAEGKLLEVLEQRGMLGDWRNLYGPDRQSIRDELNVRTLQTMPHGAYTLYFDPGPDFDPSWDRGAGGTLIAVYDYRGNKVDLAAPLDPELLDAPGELYASQIAEYYRIQVELGLTDPNAESPYAGQSDGPQVFSGEPLVDPVVLVQTSYHDPYNHEKVLLRPIDDPANPYAGQYSQWDSWLFEHAGKQDEQRQQWMMDSHSEYYELVEDAKAQGLSKAEFKEKHKDDPRFGSNGMIIDYNEVLAHSTPGWREIEGRADADGWLIPLKQVWERSLTDPVHKKWYVAPHQVAAWDAEYFHVSAGGVMSDAEFAEFSGAKAEVEAALLPPIPQWLYDNPVRLAIIGPAGDWITNGPKGSRDPQLSDEQFKNIAFDTRSTYMYRYSADGTELAVHDGSKIPSWTLLYSPEFTKELFERFSGHEEIAVHSLDGYLFVVQYELVDAVDHRGKPYKSKTNGKLLELYSWRGEALSLDTELVREGWIGERLMYHELRSYYEAQQRLMARGEYP